MRKIACALVLLASTGHGRRVQTARDQRWPSSVHARRKSWKRGLMVAFNLGGLRALPRTKSTLHGCFNSLVRERRFLCANQPPTMNHDQGEDLRTCTVSDLKARLKAAGQKVSGNKPELIARLEEMRAEQKCQESILQASHCIAAGVEHGQLLPQMYSDRIPAADEQILNFLLFFMENEGLDQAPVYINGGYVRDLLRREEPDDLDLCVCLQGSPEEVTVAGLMEKLPAFARERPELGVLNVTVVSILTNEAKNKMLDAFKSLFVNTNGQRIEVDVMPTIGGELYEEGSRTPTRDHRGCAAEDALRRDLTVGALLLKIERGIPGSSRRLSYRLFDFYEGLADLRAGVLRAPFPPHKTYQEVAAVVLRTDAARELAESLALSSRPDAEAVQILWWAKLLMDDPVRVCRALRFVGKLQGFKLHDSFWEAVPFALEALRSTVAGSRKQTEFVKIAGSGFQACKEFVELAFMRTLGPGVSKQRLAPALFGGLPATGQAMFLSEFSEFDQGLFQEFAALLQRTKEGNWEPEALLGALLAAAIVSADGLEGSIEDNFLRAIDGLSSSRLMQFTGQYPVYVAESWAEKWTPPTLLETAFASVCGVSPAAMQMYCRVWRDFKMPGSEKSPCVPLELQQLTLRIARHLISQREPDSHKEPPLPEGLPEAVSIVSLQRPPFKGNMLSTPGVLDVPPRFRAQVLALIEVTLRLVDYDGDLETSSDLATFLDRFPAVREALSPEFLASCEPELQNARAKKQKRKYR